MLRLTVALALTLPPTLAVAGSMEAVTAKLSAPGGVEQQMGAVAACLVGKGDPEATLALFAAAGWTDERDDEMGMIYIAPAQGNVYVTLGDDGRFCDAASEAIGLGEAAGMMTELSFAANVAVMPAVDADGCMTFDYDGARVTLTTTGQDPACDMGETSALRTTWGD